MRSITALLAAAPAPAPPRPAAHLRLVPPPPAPRRLAPSQRLAALGAGLVLGFLMVAAVSLPLGPSEAGLELRLAALCAVLSAPALLRARAVARRSGRAGATPARRSSTR